MKPALVHRQNQSLFQRLENYAHAHHSLDRVQEIRVSGDILAHRDELIFLMETYLFGPSCKSYVWFLSPEAMRGWLADGIQALVVHYQRVLLFLEEAFHREPQGDWRAEWDRMVPKIKGELPNLKATTIDRAKAAVTLMMARPRLPAQCGSFTLMDGSPAFPLRGGVPIFPLLPTLPSEDDPTRGGTHMPSPPRAASDSTRRLILGSPRTQVPRASTPRRSAAAGALLALGNAGQAPTRASISDQLFSDLCDFIGLPDSPASVGTGLSSMSDLGQMPDGSPVIPFIQPMPATQGAQDSVPIQRVEPLPATRDEQHQAQDPQGNRAPEPMETEREEQPTRRRPSDSPGEGPSTRRPRREPSPELDLRDFGFYWVGGPPCW